jgi:hypothetical protein
MINVDKVYKSVLLILNKEQRGYLTPDQFNKIAAQVQLELLESAYYKYNKELVKKKSGVINTDYADLSKVEKEKIDVFARTQTLTVTSGNSSLPTDMYRLVNLTVSNTTDQVEEVTKSDWNYIMASKLTTPSSKYPIYYRQLDSIKVFPSTLTSLTIDYVKKPSDPVWAYSINASANNMYIYQPTATGTGVIPITGSNNFELHPSEETSLIIGILAYAGVTIKDPTIAQAAMSQRAYTDKLEN